MYRSLLATGENFILYVVCFDDLAYQTLIKLNLTGVVAIPLIAFELPELLRVKKLRSAGEYCWTCTPHVIRYVLDNYHLSEVTYLDADLWFNERPSLLLDKFKHTNSSVLITPHRYTPRYDQSAISGIYCVQFMTFVADQRGLTTLQWWQDRCLEWCYARVEDGKFGDQKYLDDWTQRFEGIYVLENIGGGVAPWNIQQYKLSKRSDKLYVNEDVLVFYHFHNYKYYMDGTHDFGNYRLTRNVLNELYYPYAKELMNAHTEIGKVQPNFNNGWAGRSRDWRTKWAYLKRLMRGVGNEYRVV
jgi:hypothetical protein